MHRRVEQRAIRLRTMIERLNVDALALIRCERGDVYAKARWICLSCHESDACQRWLDKGANGSPDFCPILEVLNTCRTIDSAERNVA